MTGKIWKTRMEETGKTMEIIEEAKAFLKNSGVDQWQDGYQREYLPGLLALLAALSGNPPGCRKGNITRMRIAYEKILKRKI